MSLKRTIVEVLYSGRDKYEVVRVTDTSFLGTTDFYVLRNGHQVAGRYSDLRDAIAWTKRQGATFR